MSGIAGIFNRNGAPVNKSRLQSMTSIVSYRGRDGGGSWVDGPLGVSQLLLSITPESADEHSPMFDAPSELCIVFDGRIDNRQDLSSALDCHGAAFSAISDMELALKSYELWGLNCAEKILGDFAFVIWDRKKQQLFCARDIMGIRPFYYSISNSRFIFGSEIRQLFEDPSVSHRVNIEMVGEYLAHAISTHDETLYKDIMRLPPAHCLVIDKQRFKIHRYWDLISAKTVHYVKNSDYVDQYADLFRTAVDCRLRCSGKVGVTMSGGLDSTSIAGMAQSIYDDQGRGNSISSFSIIFPGRDCDEEQAIQQMNDMWGLGSFTYPFTSFEDEPAWANQVRASHELPDFPMKSAEEFLVREAGSRQVKVMLSGVGADGSFGGSPYPYLQALRSFEWSFMVQNFRHQVAERGWKIAASRLIRSLAWPLIPAPLRKFLLSLKPVGLRSGFLRPEFLSAINFNDHQRQNHGAWRFSDLAKWHIYSAAFNASGLFYHEAEERMYAKFGIEERQPFSDRRLLEFAMTVPDFEHLRHGLRKRLILKASKDLIPVSLQKYPNFGHFSNCLQEALKLRSVGTTLKSLEIAKSGWVSQGEISRQYSEFMKKSGSGLDIHSSDYRWLHPLWLIFSAETWAREASLELPDF